MNKILIPKKFLITIHNHLIYGYSLCIIIKLNREDDDCV